MPTRGQSVAEIGYKFVADMIHSTTGSDGLRTASGGEHFGSALVIIAAIIGYLLLSERLGFLLVAPLCLLAVFRAFRIGWARALLWAVGGTLVVHLAFYKLLRVPLPWGVIPPFY